jgi:hypothetical protein
MSILSLAVRIFSGITWRLESIRARWQTERDHAEAERRIALERKREEIVSRKAKRNLKTSTGGTLPRPWAKLPKAAKVTTRAICAAKATVGERTYDAGKDWIETNQLGRRNLQPQQIAVLRGNIYNRRKAKHGGDHGNQHTVAKAQNDPLPSTAAIVAAETGVSPATIKRDGKLAEPLIPLECPRCHALFGAPTGCPPAVCPSCRRETLVPKT